MGENELNRKRFVIVDTNVELMKVKKTQDDPVRFLELLRRKYPNLVIQGILSNYILDLKHVQKILTLSLEAKKAGELLSNKIETDIIMRFACTRQISDAITKVGLQKGADYVLIVVGNRSSINNLFREIEHMLLIHWTFAGNTKFIQKEFSITRKALDSVISAAPLKDILTEKSAVLIR